MSPPLRTGPELLQGRWLSTIDLKGPYLGLIQTAEVTRIGEFETLTRLLAFNRLLERVASQPC